MPQRVINNLKMVNIKIENRSVITPAFTGDHGMLQTLHGQTPIWQPCQLIVKCQPLNSILGFLAFFEIDKGSHVVGYIFVNIINRSDGQQIRIYFTTLSLAP